MKKRTIILIAAATALLTTLFALPLTITGSDPNVTRGTPTVSREPARDHRLETWLSALEWCESQGVSDAVNEVDLDGTPSYFWYQFKPSTFLAYGKQYGILASTTPLEGILDREMRDYEKTRDIVRHMAVDKTVDMWRQFPGCMRKLGPPPKPPKIVCEADCPLIDPNATPAP